MRAAPLASLAAVVLAGCGHGSSAPTAATRPAAVPSIHASASDPVIAAAGDIACSPASPVTGSQCHQAVTAVLLGQLHPAAVLAIGDEQYETGALRDFRRAYGPSWGRFDSIVRAAPGNHEYATRGASGYFGYFGGRGGPAGRGYYSFGVGPWHLIALNSNCAIVSCASGSAQVRWLRADLAAHRTRCTLAFWHHPRFSSGLHGDTRAVASLWQALYAGGADLVLAGHDHDFERFAPQNASGKADSRRGIREFVVGTGGRSHYPMFVPRPNSQRRNSTTFGVLALTLHRDGYTWRFVAEPGSNFGERGSARCH